MAEVKVNPFFQKGYKAPKKIADKKADKEDDTQRKQWIEKYRPKSLQDVMSQKEVVKVLSSCCDTVDRETGAIELPNLLMYGPPGTGKTSSALALAKDLFGTDILRERVLELNASDDRGIKVIRTKIKDFAQRTVKTQNLKQVHCVHSRTGETFKRPPASIKLIILDECDSMTRAAQEALRRTMEKYSATTRFVLIVNYVTKIIGPIASRCAKLRFTSLDDQSKIDRLKHIASTESLDITDDAIDALVSIAKGDLRRCVNFLQSAVNVVDQSENEKKLLEKRHVEMVTVVVPVDVVKTALDVALNHEYNTLKEVVDEIASEAYSIHDFLELLLSEVCNESIDNISNLQKAYIIEKIGEADGALIDGADEYLQLLNVLTSIQTIKKTITE